MVIEILSPYDSTLEKFDFYGRHGADELLVADPEDHTIRIWQYDRQLASYLQTDVSDVLAVTCSELRARIPLAP